MFENNIDGTGGPPIPLYLSLPWFWLKETRLSSLKSTGIPIQATIESSERSEGGYRKTITLQVWYSYSFEGQSYSGQLVRDTCFY
jgi:hypothetical protein